MEQHLRVKFKAADVNNLGYSCVWQVLYKFNNTKTESASGVNLAYQKYFQTLLESDPGNECCKLQCQGWYWDVAGQMDKWGGDASKLTNYNVGGLMCQKALVNSPVPCTATSLKLTKTHLLTPKWNLKLNSTVPNLPSWSGSTTSMGQAWLPPR